MTEDTDYLDDDGFDPLEGMSGKDAYLHASTSELTRFNQLRKVTKTYAEWTYIVRYASPEAPDFSGRANYEELAGKYPFLDKFDNSIGFNFAENGASAEKLTLPFDEDEKGSLEAAIENYLFGIDEDEWDSFITDAKACHDGETLDDEKVSNMEFKAIEEFFDRSERENIGDQLAKDRDLGTFGLFVGTVMTLAEALDLYNVSNEYAEFSDGSAYVDVERMLEAVSDDQLETSLSLDEKRILWDQVRSQTLADFLPLFETKLLAHGAQTANRELVENFLSHERSVKLAYLKKQLPDSNYYDDSSCQISFERRFGGEAPEDGAIHWFVMDGKLKGHTHRENIASSEAAANTLAREAIESGFEGLDARRPVDPDHPVLNFESASKLAASLLEADEDEFDDMLDPKAEMLNPHYIADFVGSADGMDVYTTTDKELIERLYVGTVVGFTHAVVVVPDGALPENATEDGVEGSWSVIWSMEHYARIMDDNGYTESGMTGWDRMKAGPLAAKSVIDLFLGTFDDSYTRQTRRDQKPEDVASDLLIRFGSPGDYQRFRDVDAVPWRLEYYSLDLAIEYGSRGMLDEAKAALDPRRRQDPEMIQPNGMVVESSRIEDFFWVYSDEDEARQEYDAAVTGIVNAPEAELKDILLQLDDHSLDALRSRLPGNTVPVPGEGPKRLKPDEAAQLDKETLLWALQGKDPAMQPVVKVIREVYEHAWQDTHANEVTKAITSDIETKVGQMVDRGTNTAVLVPWANMRYYRTEARESWGYEHEPKPIDYLEKNLRGDAGALTASFEWETDIDFHERFNELFLERIGEAEMPSDTSDTLQTQMDL